MDWAKESSGLFDFWYKITTSIDPEPEHSSDRTVSYQLQLPVTKC